MTVLPEFTLISLNTSEIKSQTPINSLFLLLMRFNADLCGRMISRQNGIIAVVNIRSAVIRAPRISGVNRGDINDVLIDVR